MLCLFNGYATVAIVFKVMSLTGSFTKPQSKTIKMSFLLLNGDKQQHKVQHSKEKVLDGFTFSVSKVSQVSNKN